ncbi:MAG: hypothetical protein ACRDT0_16845 [Pseudonocardiaceae bacterium]
MIADLAPGADIVAVEPSVFLRVGLVRLADNPDLQQSHRVGHGHTRGCPARRIGGAVAMNMIGHLDWPTAPELWRRLAAETVWPRQSRGYDGQPFVLRKVGEVFDVQGCQGKVERETAGGDPCIVCGSWLAATFSESRNLTPYAGHIVRAVCHADPA